MHLKGKGFYMGLKTHGTLAGIKWFKLVTSILASRSDGAVASMLLSSTIATPAVSVWHDHNLEAMRSSSKLKWLK